jgi:hypothetical protein
MMKKVLIATVVLFTATLPCHASIPEIDPSSTSAGLVLLAGMAFMLRGRFKK